VGAGCLEKRQKRIEETGRTLLTPDADVGKQRHLLTEKPAEGRARWWVAKRKTFGATLLRRISICCLKGKEKEERKREGQERSANVWRKEGGQRLKISSACSAAELGGAQPRRLKGKKKKKKKKKRKLTALELAILNAKRT